MSQTETTPVRSSSSALATTKKVAVRTVAGLAMFAVFVGCAFAALRVAIHGREVTVPNLASLSDTDADAALKKLGLNLSVENRFYAGSVMANHVLSQSPSPGSHVRRGWQIRVTESLGPQQVPVPEIIGQDQHPAALMLKRLQLELGMVAHLPGPSPAGVILAQSPAPNISGLDGPRVAILVADDAEAPDSVAYVMPSIVGLTVRAAQSRLSTVGLHLAMPSAPDASASPDAAPVDGTAAAGAPAVAPDPAIPPTITPAYGPDSIITSQTPQPGHRVSRADSIHVALSNQP